MSASSLSVASSALILCLSMAASPAQAQIGSLIDLAKGAAQALKDGASATKDATEAAKGVHDVSKDAPETARNVREAVDTGRGGPGAASSDRAASVPPPSDPSVYLVRGEMGYGAAAAWSPREVADFQAFLQSAGMCVTGKATDAPDDDAQARVLERMRGAPHFPQMIGELAVQYAGLKSIERGSGTLTSRGEVPLVVRCVARLKKQAPELADQRFHYFTLANGRVIGRVGYLDAMLLDRAYSEAGDRAFIRTFTRQDIAIINADDPTLAAKQSGSDSGNAMSRLAQGISQAVAAKKAREEANEKAGAAEPDAK